MVLISYISEHVAKHEKKIGLFDKNIRFVTALDRIKCLTQVKYQRLLLTCAPVNKLPSCISKINITALPLNKSRIFQPFYQTYIIL